MPTGTVEVAWVSRKRKGEGTRPLRADSIWRRKAAEEGRIRVIEGGIHIRFLFAHEHSYSAFRVCQRLSEFARHAAGLGSTLQSPHGNQVDCVSGAALKLT